MDEMMGEHYYRKQPMSEIRAADYDDLKYFFDWSKAITRAEVKAANDTGKGKR